LISNWVRDGISARDSSLESQSESGQFNNSGKFCEKERNIRYLTLNEWMHITILRIRNVRIVIRIILRINCVEWVDAPFFNNSAKKDYVMKVFSRDPQCRALWERNVQRENWTATNNSCLCEVKLVSNSTVINA